MVSSSSSLTALADAARGIQFSEFVRSATGLLVAPVAPDAASFSMLVAFGRCRCRLEIPFVAGCLSSILGGPPSSFHVSQFEDRIFFFLVSNKQIGFKVYNLRKFACSDFELFFQLFNESGLAHARANINPVPIFPWVEVGKRQPAAAAPKRAALLTGANSIPLGANRMVTRNRTNPNPRLLAVQHNSQHFQSSSKADNHGWPHRQPNNPSLAMHHRQLSSSAQHSVHSVHQQSSVRQQISNGHRSSGGVLAPNLDLNLSLGIQSSGTGNSGNVLASVRCWRCHSPSHSRWTVMLQLNAMLALAGATSQLTAPRSGNASK